MISVDDLKLLSGSRIYNESSLKGRSFTGAGIDSRMIKKSEIFFAIKGETTDGHKYLDGVVKSGIKLVVLGSRKLKSVQKKINKVAYVTVPDTIKALGELARNHRRKFDIPVLCIGGSNGKTTTKDLTADVLSQKFKVLKTKGNFNNHIGLPLILLKLKKSHEMCVLEVGCNHFDEIKYLCGIAEPQYGMVTNIGREHLEFFKTEKGVAKAEFELYDYLKKTGGVCFLNLDDDYIRGYGEKVVKSRKFTYSYKYRTDVKGKFVRYTNKFEPVIKVKKGSMEFEAKISTFGKHSIFNGLAAASAGLYFGISKSGIKKALSTFKPSSSKRMEVEVKGSITLINDAYNSNPDSVKMGLETLSEFKTKGNKYVVLSDMLELGATSSREHSGVGRLAKEMKFENLYTCGKESYNTFKSAKGIKNNFYFDKKEDLISMLNAVVKSGDVVYVKGSRGMKMEDVINAL